MGKINMGRVILGGIVGGIVAESSGLPGGWIVAWAALG